MSDQPSADEIVDGTPLRWEGSVLVYAGSVPADLDIIRLIDSVREERMRHILGLQDSPEEPARQFEE